MCASLALKDLEASFGTQLGIQPCGFGKPLSSTWEYSRKATAWLLVSSFKLVKPIAFSLWAKTVSWHTCDFLLASWSQTSSVKYGAKLFTLWPAWTSLTWLPSFWQSLVMPSFNWLDMLWLKLSYCGFSNKATMSWLFHFWIAWAFSRRAVTVGPCWGFIRQ